MAYILEPGCCEIERSYTATCQRCYALLLVSEADLYRKGTISTVINTCLFAGYRAPGIRTAYYNCPVCNNQGRVDIPKPRHERLKLH